MSNQGAVHKFRPLLLISMGLLSGVAWPVIEGRPLWISGLFLGLTLGITDWLFPWLTNPLWQGLEWLGKKISHYNGIMLSGLFYLFIITPASALMRLSRSIFRKNHRPRSSYYQPPEARPEGHMKRTF